jgi:beta-aspartyl-peptidase (threonine type)
MRVSFRSVFLASGVAVVLVLFASVRLLGTLDQGRDADTKAINEVLKAQQAAWNRGDVDAFLDGYWRSPELTFSGSNGVSRGRDGVLARYKKSYPNHAAMGQLEFSDLELRFLGPDAALVLGQWHLKRESGDIGGVFTLVWQKFPDGWKIIHDHTSAVGAKQ